MTRAALFFALISPLLLAQSRQVVAIAHRGEHIRNPENTLPAYAEAIRLGADYIEVDVRTSADGVLVVSHDKDVKRCTNGQGEVGKMTLAQLRMLDAGGGAKLPLFDEVLQMARGKIKVYVDLKQATSIDLVKHIEDHGMTDQVVIYSGKQSAEIQQLNSKLKIMPESVSVDVVKQLIATLHPRVIAFGAKDWTPEIIRLAKQSKAELYVDRMGSTDNPAGWQIAIDEGADGIQTDHPGELVQYLIAKGYKH